MRECPLWPLGAQNCEGPFRGQFDVLVQELGFHQVCQLLRLLQLSGRGVPEWHADGSVFDRRTLGQLVAYIDAHLKIAPCLSDMCLRVGISPSHFARKFRQSTGLSLHRFINRRRILSSFELLKDHSRPLADTALELGFSSQSHFTRLFSGLTGMTPAKYRKQVKRTVG